MSLYPKTISDSLDFSKIKGHSLKIKVRKDAEPVFTTSARAIPLHWLQEAKKIIHDLISNDIIEKVNEATEWLAPAFFVLKPHQKPGEPVSLRFVCDLSGLNRHVVRNAYTFFSSHEILQRLPPNSKYFAALDCLHGYFQVEVQLSSRKYLNFLLPSELGPKKGGKFRFRRSPMGLSTSADDFNRITDTCLFEKGPLHDDRGRCLKLVDDLIVCSPTMEKLEDLLNEVLSRLHESNIKVSRKKFTIATKVPFAGYMVSAEGVTPDPARIESLKKLPAPTNRRQLRGLIGALMQLQAFKVDLSSSLKPMMELLSTNKSFIWTEAQDSAFQRTKDLLCSKMSLDYYDPSRPTLLMTDASNLGIGAAVVQRCPVTGKYSIIMCRSRTLSPAETRYSVSEKELLAAVFGMKKHQYFLLGLQSFELLTDHRSLCGIFSKPLNDLPSTRITNLRLKVAHFNVRVTYVKGCDNLIPDLLSRFPVQRCEPEEVVCNLISSQPVDPKIKRLQQKAKEDPEYALLLEKFRSNGRPDADPKHPAFCYQSIWKDIHEHDGILLYHDRLLIPKNARSDILKLIHMGHKGPKSAKLVGLSRYFWPNIGHEISQYVKNCEGCIQHKPSQTHQDVEITQALHPFQILGIDAWQSSCHHFLTVVDNFSSFTWTKEVKYPNTQNTIAFLESLFFSLCFQPEILRCDSATYFLNAQFEEWAKSWDLTVRPSSPHFHQSNGLAERNLAKIKGCIEKNKGVLSREVRLHMMEVNNSPLVNAKLSPSELLFGWTLRTCLPTSKNALKPVDRHAAIKRKTTANRQQCDSVNKSSKNLSLLRIGQKCILQSQNPVGKRLWDRKGIITDVRESQQSYKVEYMDNNGTKRHVVRNRIHLRPYSPKKVSFSNPISSKINANPSPSDRCAM